MDDAVVYNNKIYGVSGPYVMRFDGTTGVKEATQRVAQPLRGPMSIATVGTMIYVAGWDDPSVNSTAAQLRKQIFPVNPTTLAIGTGFGWAQLFDETYHNTANGPKWIAGAFSKIYGTLYSTANQSKTFIFFIDPLNLTDNSGTATTDYPEQVYPRECLGFGPGAFGGGYIYTTSTWDLEVWRITADISTNGPFGDVRDYFSVTPHRPIGIVHSTAASKQYVVCGTENLLRIDSWATHSTGTYTVLNLGAVQANVAPFKIFNNSYDGKLYIPDQVNDGIIVWDTTSETGVWKSGFAAPLGCVFTATKKWAFQQSATGLKEIT